MRGWLKPVPGFLFRAALTLAAVYVFALIVQLVWVNAFVNRMKADPPVPMRDISRAGSGGSSKVRRMWPVFPGGKGPSDLRKMTLNNVPLISESWEVTASSPEILDYYRSQMTARGWQDVTEEEYNLEPETRALARGEPSLQDPRYVETYIKVVESNLVLRRGQWSVHVAVGAGESRWHRSITVSAAKTESILKFGADIAEAMADDSRKSELAVREETDSGRFDTSIATSDFEPQKAFIEKWEQLCADSWSSLFRSGPTGKGSPFYFAVMQKGDTYGYLTVSPQQGGKGSSVVVTKVLESGN